MELGEAVHGFFSEIKNDPRIGAGHISIFFALLKLSLDQNSRTVHFRSSELMIAAKVSQATFSRCIKLLHQRGYINYRASFNHRKKSRVSIG